MNPVNATALYVSACRAVLQCDPRQPHTLAEMYKLLPFFRQSLSCLVCGNLLQDPIAPTNSTCQHYVCRACKGQRMQLKPSCSWCKDYSCFQENNQLSLLVNCYRQLCRYITHSPLLQQINSQLGGSLEIMTLLEEGLGAEGLETEEPSSPVLEELNPSVPLTPLTPPPPPLVHPPSLPHPHPAVPPPCLNGPQGCNGAVLEDLAPSSPELEVCDPVEEQPLGGGGLPEPEVTAEAVAEEGAGGGKREAGPGCGGLEVGLAPRPLAATTPGGVCSLREGGTASMEGEEGGVLLLSVEQVLQTLDPLHPSIDSHVPTYRTHTYNHIQPDRTHAVALHNAHAHTGTSPHPPPVPAPPTVRLSRKRSHSESDRERVQPLPIACILQGSHARNPTHTPPPTPTPAPPHTPHTQPPAPLPNIPTHTPLSNGGHPKPSRPPSLTPGKGVRKLPEQGPKRPHAGRARAVGPKAKDRPRDHRLLSGCLLPPSPSKPLYKKPVEKKGCKCGRATQNPSVLTCRGQRCPCYSNRKACLDCICRGCQNSYMANGEKKLEAFAVPEKALEQTRLTLGINLTSITAAAAALRNPATSSVHGNALINVTTATGAPVAAAFLSPSPPRDPAYEDSLDLGFHC